MLHGGRQTFTALVTRPAVKKHCIDLQCRHKCLVRRVRPQVFYDFINQWKRLVYSLLRIDWLKIRIIGINTPDKHLFIYQIMLPKIRNPHLDWQIALRIFQKLFSELRIRQVDF